MTDAVVPTEEFVRPTPAQPVNEIVKTADDGRLDAEMLHDLYEDQVPPVAPGVPGNGSIVNATDGIDHGVVADGHVVEVPTVGPPPSFVEVPVAEAGVEAPFAVTEVPVVPTEVVVAAEPVPGVLPAE